MITRERKTTDVLYWVDAKTLAPIEPATLDDQICTRCLPTREESAEESALPTPSPRQGGSRCRMTRGERWQVIEGDCLEVLPTLGRVGAVITDPPYGVDVAEWDARVPTELLAQFLRLTDGPIVWFGSASGIGADIAAFQPPPQRIVIWAPSFSLSRTMAHGMAYRWHPIHCWQLPKKHDGPCWDVVHHNTECGNAWNHPCTKPLSLMLSIVGFAPPDSTVLDPFCGSGTTGVAAIRLGRKFIGIEKNHDYAQIARDRLAAEEEGSTLQARRAGQLSLLAGVK